MEVALVALLMSMVVCGSLMEAVNGAVYHVGDSAGWTTIGNVDYKQWAATKTFKLGDTVVFTYNKQFHNVMQVKHADYRSCNASEPMSTHSTGNDTIVIKTYGHHYYICAVPGHCQSGQKVDINVQRISSALAPTPSAPDSSVPASLLLPPATAPSSTAILHKPTSVGQATPLTMSLIKLGLGIMVFVGIV